MIGAGVEQNTETVPIQSSSDVVMVRQKVRAMAIAQGFSLVDQTKLVTAASELGRNTLEHGGGGQVVMCMLQDGRRRGVRLVFEDHGCGIADIALALRDGYTSGKGMGLGLGGSKRLVNEFDLQSAPNLGTTVTVVRWK